MISRWAAAKVLEISSEIQLGVSERIACECKMSGVTMVKAFDDGKVAVLMVMLSSINRCPLLGSTAWRDQIKFLVNLFPVVANGVASGWPTVPKICEHTPFCLRSSPLPGLDQRTTDPRAKQS